MKKFTSVHDIPNLQAAVQEALTLKKAPFRFEELGKRKTIGLVFFNPSLRTRMSTQKAAQNLGMNTIVLNTGQDSWALELEDGVVMNGTTVEHIREAAGVMGEYCDILGVRSFAGLQDREKDYADEVLHKMIAYSGKPVVSLESAIRHPLQSFADLITIEELKTKPRPKVVLTWAPHPKALPQAVANSFAEWMHRADVDLVIAHPEGYDLAGEFTDGVEITHDQKAAFDGADFIYAKNWSSYTDYGRVLSQDTSWTVTMEKMARTNNARFLHCLPVRRNMIVEDAVLDSPVSAVIQQAGNRVYAAQTVLKQMLEQQNEKNDAVYSA